jgi:hypothetical protein
MEQRSVNVPPGRPVMVDGVIDAGEWSDAALAETVAGRLHIKEVGEFVLVGLELPGQSAGFVDLFITAGGGPLYDLHASARLGERILTGRVWPEWHWWNNSGWVANVSRVESFDERTFLPEHARAFQIRRSRFPGRPWRIRLLTTVMKGKEITTLVWPEKTEDTNAAGWLELELSITARPVGKHDQGQMSPSDRSARHDSSAVDWPPEPARYSDCSCRLVDSLITLFDSC